MLDCVHQLETPGGSVCDGVYPVCTCSVPWVYLYAMYPLSAGCVEVWDLEMLDCVHQLETPGSSVCD